MIDQHHGQPALHQAVGREILFPQLRKSFLDYRQMVMRIKSAFAQPREVLAGANDPGRF
jgi:hypothetical protein